MNLIILPSTLWAVLLCNIQTSTRDGLLLQREVEVI